MSAAEDGPDMLEVRGRPGEEGQVFRRPRSTLGTKTASMPWEGPWIEIERGSSKKVIRNKIYTSPAGYVRREYSNYKALHGLTTQFSSSSLSPSVSSHSMISMQEELRAGEGASRRARSRPGTSVGKLPRPDSSPATILNDLSAQVSRNFVRPKSSLGTYSLGYRAHTPAWREKPPPARTPLRPVTAMPLSKQKQLEEKVKTEMYGDLVQSKVEEDAASTREKTLLASPHGRKDEELKPPKPLLRDKSLTFSDSTLSAKDVPEDESMSGQSFKERKGMTPARKRLTNVMGAEGFSRVWTSDKSLEDIDPSLYFKMRMKMRGLKERTSMKVLDTQQWIGLLLYAEGKNERIPLNKNAERWISGLDTFLDKRARLRIYEQQLARADADLRDAMLEVNRIESLLKIEQGSKKKNLEDELTIAMDSKDELLNERRRLQMLVNTFTIGAEELQDLTAEEDFYTGDPNKWSDILRTYRESDENLIKLKEGLNESKSGWFELNADIDIDKYPIYSSAPLSPSAHEIANNSTNNLKNQKKTVPTYERRTSRRRSLITMQSLSSMKEKGSQRKMSVAKSKVQKAKSVEQGKGEADEPVVVQEEQQQQERKGDDDSDEENIDEQVKNLLSSMQQENSAALNQALMRLKYPVQTGTMRTWREYADDLRRVKKSYLTIYERICEHFKVPATGLVAIRRFLNDPLCSKISVAGENYNNFHLTALDGMMRGVDLTGGNAVIPPVLSFKKSMDLMGLRSFDCSNNNLRAEGMSILVDMLTSCGLDVEYLNVSANRIGKEGAQKIAKFLSIPNSSIQELHCDMNDIGDVGMRAIALVLPKTQLKVLSVQKNKISKLGAVALRRMIASESVCLQDLDVSWNEILTDGACTFAEGLADNKSLRRLNLEWSGFGSEKALSALFHALKTCPLQVVDLSSNQIDSYGCLVVSAGIESTQGLKQLKLDNNPLARQGIRELLRCSARAKERRSVERAISLENCDFGEVSSCVFDPLEPAGSYRLDMGRASHRRIFEVLLEFNAQGRGRFDKSSATLKLDRKGETSSKTFSLSSSNLLDSTSLPLEGILEFGFVENGLPSPCDQYLREEAMKALLDQLNRRDLSAALKKRSMQTAVGCLYLKLEDFEAMFARINVNDVDYRMDFVMTVYHRVIDLDDATKLLRYLSDAEARNVEARIGKDHLHFSSSNPTGHYHLNLDKPPHRNMACRLLSMRFQMLPVEDKIVKYYSNRKGGQREVARIGVCWRNCRLSGLPFDIEADWNLPFKGILELDYVCLDRPDGEEAMSDEEFDELVLRRWDEKSQFLNLQILSNERKISLLREVSNTHYFSCNFLPLLL
uniref:Uncharacterized protein n=1 Tax=Guillardia theta TaxID=55529 RepID=A0A7S4PPF8_GUITH|mmetsp:Transcript_7953/g.26645  ORF Transcript_7953/g.26645 Transcript_7953/m.26645 type:complete len:1332 (+) Transcript_7953:239-4234(+)